MFLPKVRRLAREYFSFTRSERRGIMVLGFILLVVIFIHFIAGHPRQPDSPDKSKWFQYLAKNAIIESENPEIKRSLFGFDPNTISEKSLDSLDIPSSLKKNLIRYRIKGGRFSKPEDIRKLYGMNDSLYALIMPKVIIQGGHSSPTYGNVPASGVVVERERFSFDPNAVTFDDLLRLGFTTNQAKNLISYRQKGAKFRQREDLLRIYGIDTVLCLDIMELVEIKPEFYADKAKGEQSNPQVKLELNTADSLALTRLPGIGAVLAGRILRFRLALGGFCSTSQIREVYGMKEDNFQLFKDFISVDSTRLKKIRLNFASTYEMERHPYISKKQAEEIVNLRSAFGPFTSGDEIFDHSIFDEQSFNKIKPYLSCR